MYCVHDYLTTIRNISLIYSRNSEAVASEFLDYIEEMFLRYYMHSVASLIITPVCVARGERGIVYNLNMLHIYHYVCSTNEHVFNHKY